MTKMLIALAFVLLTATLRPTPATAQDEAAAKAAFAAAEAALAPHFDDFFLDGDPQAPALLKRKWSAISDWTASYLNAHPGATAEDLMAEAKKLSPNQEVQAIKLDDGAFLASAWAGAIGSAFIVAARGGVFAPVWSAGDAAETPPAAFKPLAAWSAANARGECRVTAQPDAWGVCGPVSSSIGRLADDRDGARRFYLDATYAQAAGATVSAQFSVWSWNGEKAEPLYLDTYSYMIEQGEGLRVEGDVVKIRTKDEFKTFFACGACPGRQMEWTIRVDSGGVKDLGKTSLAPELDLIDSVYERMFKGEPVSELIGSAAAKVLHSAMDEARQETAPGSSPSLGMLSNWKSTKRASGWDVCLSTDNGGAHVFAIAAAGHPRITKVRAVKDEECAK
jgi:hypothetical protein